MLKRMNRIEEIEPSRSQGDRRLCVKCFDLNGNGWACTATASKNASSRSGGAARGVRGIKKAKQPMGKPGAPPLIRVVGTESKGAVNLSWKQPVRRYTSTIQMAAAPATRGWKQVSIGIRQFRSVTGLRSG